MLEYKYLKWLHENYDKANNVIFETYEDLFYSTHKNSSLKEEQNILQLEYLAKKLYMSFEEYQVYLMDKKLKNKALTPWEYTEWEDRLRAMCAGISMREYRNIRTKKHAKNKGVAVNENYIYLLKKWIKKKY